VSKRKIINLIKKITKNEQGQVLPLVLILLVLGSTLLAGTLAYGSASLKTSEINADRAKQLSSADAGIRYATWKLTNEWTVQDRLIDMNTGSSTQYFINENGKDVIVDIYCYRNQNYSRIFKITSTASGNSSSTLIESWVTKLSGLWENACTGGESVDIWWGGNTVVEGPVVFPYDTSLWPFAAGDFRTIYSLQAGPKNPLSIQDNLWDVSVDGNILPSLYYDKASGTLDILNSSLSPVWAVLGNGLPPAGGYNSTIYVNGNLTIGKSGSKEFTLDLNRNTIYVTGDLLIDASCKLVGSGCIIAQGQIQFKPNLESASPSDFVFIMSLSDKSYSVQFQPSGNFYGSIAGNINVDLHPGNSVILTEPPDDGLNFPLDMDDLTSKWAFRTWQIDRLSGGSAGALIITTGLMPQGEVGILYSKILEAANGNPPYSWYVDALPNGLSLDPLTGEIHGTPTTAVTVGLTAYVEDSAGDSATKELSIKICPNPEILTASPLPDGELGIGYYKALAVAPGVPPYSWSITSGALPAGLSINEASGVISGIPTVAGTFNFTVKVTDGLGGEGTKIMSLTIQNAPVITTASPLPDAEVGVVYALTFTATGGLQPYTWSNIGNLPTGFALGPATGTMSGIATKSINYSFTINVTDAAGVTGSKDFYITIQPPVEVSTASLPNGVVGTAYSQTLAAAKGVPPYSWSITAGSLPPGLTLNLTGIISGTPTSSNTYNFTARVADAAGGTASKALTITINSALAISNTTLPNGVISKAYSQTVSATGGIVPYTWSITSGALPSGLAINPSTGVISGTPSMTGTYTFEVTVKDSTGGTAAKTFTIKVDTVLTITTLFLPAGSVDTLYELKLTASGGLLPLSWSAVDPTKLPPGMNLLEDGTFYGIPTKKGTYNIVFQVRDSGVQTVTTSLQIKIN
jgi:hypothetical protein